MYHKDSVGHKGAVEIDNESKKEKFEGVCLKAMAKQKEITWKSFKLLTKLQRKQSINNFEDEINLQKLHSLHMGRILHPTNACNHIINQMRKLLIKEIIWSQSAKYLC